MNKISSWFEASCLLISENKTFPCDRILQLDGLEMGNNFYYIDIVDDHGDDDYVQQQPAGGGPDEVVGALSQCT